MILLERRVFQCVSPTPDGDRAQQQTFERGAEGGIAALESANNSPIRAASHSSPMAWA
jgi:hypothetical protein